MKTSKNILFLGFGNNFQRGLFLEPLNNIPIDEHILNDKELIEIRIPKIYLETTIFNYYFDTERDAHADTVKLFEEIKTGKYKAYTSPYAVGELEKAPAEKYLKMLKLIEDYDIIILAASDEVAELGLVYQERGILPSRSTVDALHIAVATVHDMDMILSLNFEHIVRKKTLEMTGYVNAELGYRPIKIYSPMEVVEREQS